MATRLTTNQADRPELLAQLLAPPTAEPIDIPVADPRRPAAPVEPEASPVPRRRSERMSVPALLAALALFGALWITDSYFTLLALAAWGLPIVVVLAWPWLLPIDRVLPWLIPIGIEVIEQSFIGRRGWPLIAFLVVSIPNAIAAAYGLYVQFGDGGALDLSNWQFVARFAIAGTLLAFLPGRGMVWAVTSLRQAIA